MIALQRYSMTGSLAQDCGLHDRRISVFVTFICGENLKGKVYRNTRRTAEAVQNGVVSVSADELSVFLGDPIEDERRV
jgi:hypothetical protein